MWISSRARPLSSPPRVTSSCLKSECQPGRFPPLLLPLTIARCPGGARRHTDAARLKWTSTCSACERGRAAGLNEKRTRRQRLEASAAAGGLVEAPSRWIERCDWADEPGNVREPLHLKMHFRRGEGASRWHTRARAFPARRGERLFPGAGGLRGEIYNFGGRGGFTPARLCFSRGPVRCAGILVSWCGDPIW